MAERVIDLVPEEQDVESVREDWHWLVGPLAECIKLPVEKSPSELYINTTKKLHANQPEYNQYGNGIIYFPDEWENRYTLMISETLLPKILIERIGVGKTAWLERFMHYLKEQEKVFYYYYNHNKEHGGPVGGQFKDPSDKLHCFLYANFLMILKKACQENGLSSLEIMDYNEDEAAENLGYITFSRARALTEACNHLNKKDVKIFFIIDNLDEYSRDVQKKALGIADHIAKFVCIYPIIALRPETYHGTQAYLNNPRHHAITSVSLNQILRKRYEYLWNMGGRKSLQDVLDKLDRISLSLSYTDKIIDYNFESLKRLHEKIINVLSESKILEEALNALHNYNMREILAVVSRLLMSGFFSDGIIYDLKNDAKRGRKIFGNDREAIITTYLRGPFKRYRKSDDKENEGDYPVKILNVFEVGGISNDDLLITVRVMQIAGYANHTGISVEKIIEDLIEIEYKKTDISVAIQFLAKHGFIDDVKEQKAWGKEDDIELSDTDMFKLSPAGNYLITKLFDEFAFRYCEAIANTMYRSRTDSVPWSQETDMVSLVENAIGVLKLIISASESEWKRIRTDKTKLEKFKKTFLSPDVVGSNFLLKITEGCDKMAKHIKNVLFNRQQNYNDQRKLKIKIAEIGMLIDKVKNIYK